MTVLVDPRVSLNGVCWNSSVEDDVELCRGTGIKQLGVPNRTVSRVELLRAAKIVESAPAGVSTACHPRAVTLARLDRWVSELAEAKRPVDYALALSLLTVRTTTGPRGKPRRIVSPQHSSTRSPSGLLTRAGARCNRWSSRRLIAHRRFPPGCLRVLVRLDIPVLPGSALFAYD
jgi:hypothetical protein